jgi:predicted DNA-binding WGR domain protein
MADVKAWREGAPGEPAFPDGFAVLRKAVLQVTDITTNRNKYYAVELHAADSRFRIYTHYGRTDDLETNPNAGMREARYFNSLDAARGQYEKIYREKTSPAKGYRELSLASTRIGSKQTLGQSSGEIDDATLRKLAEKKAPPAVDAAPAVTLPAEVRDLVGHLYAEATHALTTTVNAAITANGIETPLGVLTIGQIDKGQAILDALAGEFGKKRPAKAALTDLSGEFYTVIPHRFGRTRAAALDAVIDSAGKLNEKQETLQLMRDMLTVNGDTNVLLNPEVERKYSALNCRIEQVPAGRFREVKEHVEGSAVRKCARSSVRDVWQVRRPGEHEGFAEAVGNTRLLFHGSAAKNWVGILARGLLLPKIVVTLGVKRTDAGWLGNGIYFGDAICTSAGYAHPGSRRTRFVAVAGVALGKSREYRKITYGLTRPPEGFDSCHGVRGSEFADDEYVVYDTRQQRLEYLVELAA